MIEKILTKGMWVGAVGNVPQSHSATIFVGQKYIQRPYATAQIALSRLEGNGFAKAYISSYEYQPSIFSSNVMFQPVEPPISNKDPLLLVKGTSQYGINRMVSVTFGLYVKNMFAYANCSIFVHQSRNFADVLLTPVYYFGESFGGSRSSQDTKSLTSLVFDKKSGEISHRHTTVVLQNGKFPSENDLKVSALASAAGMTKLSETKLDVLTISEELSPNKKYKVDVKTGRLVSRDVK